MNSDSSQPPENDLAIQRAAALETARQRVEAGEHRRAEAARLEAQQRRREQGIFAPNARRDFLNDLLGWRMMIFAGFSAIGLILSSLLWLAEALRWPIFYLFRSLDLATGAHALRQAPFLVWALWGALFGGCLGYWLVAPVYGDRENRSFVLLLPILTMAIVAAIIWAFYR